MNPPSDVLLAPPATNPDPQALLPEPETMVEPPNPYTTLHLPPPMKPS